MITTSIFISPLLRILRVGFSRCSIAITAAFILTLTLLGCRENESTDESRPQEVAFSISTNLPNTESSHQASTSSISQVTQAIVTITKSDGVATEYTNASIEVYQFDGWVFTKNISLLPGAYKVTAFALASESNEILYATPMEGSPLTDNVTTHLEVDFEVEPNEKNEIPIEVVSVSGQNPSDFGLLFFEIGVMETIDFLISVTELGGTGFIPSTLTITDGEGYEYTQELTGEEDAVQVRAQSALDYTVMVTAIGHTPFEAVLSPAELMSYEIEEKLFVVELVFQAPEATIGGNGIDKVFSFQQTADGGFIVAGYGYTSSTDFIENRGLEDAWVYKLDHDRNLEWQYTYGGSGSDKAYDVVQTSDGGYIIGASTNSSDGDVSENLGGYDIWVYKLDANGKLVWERSYGTPENEGINSVFIQQTTDAGYVLAASLNTAEEGPKIKVLKLTTAGDSQWDETLNKLEFIHEIIQTTDGGYVAAGKSNREDMFLQKLAPDGQTEWTKTVDLDGLPGSVSAIVQADDGGYIACGTHGRVIKLDASGELEWNYKSNDYDYLESVAVTSSGDYLIAGADGDPLGVVGAFYLLNVDQNGQLLSTKSHAIPGGYFYSLTEVDQLAGGNLAFLINRRELALGKVSNRPLIVELDSEGNLVSGN